MKDNFQISDVMMLEVVIWIDFPILLFEICVQGRDSSHVVPLKRSFKWKEVSAVTGSWNRDYSNRCTWKLNLPLPLRRKFFEMWMWKSFPYLYVLFPEIKAPVAEIVELKYEVKMLAIVCLHTRSMNVLFVKWERLYMTDGLIASLEIGWFSRYTGAAMSIQVTWYA